MVVCQCSGELGAGLHRQRSLRGRAPTARRCRSPSGWPQTREADGCRTAGRTALNAKRRTRASGCCAAQQVEQQRRDQRAVHDQARIALDLGDVAAVVVDAVAVEGQRRVAEQQHRRRARSRARRPRRSARRWRLAPASPGCGGVAVDDVVLFGQRDAARVGDLVAHRARTPARRCGLPCASTSAMRDVRVIASPTRSGCAELAAGRRPTCGAAAAPAAGSRRASDGRRGRSRSAARAAGSTASATAAARRVPGTGGGSSRSSVADSAAIGAALTWSARRSVRPIHCCQCFASIACSLPVFMGR